jgi:hypothetical protein
MKARVRYIKLGTVKNYTKFVEDMMQYIGKVIDVIPCYYENFYSISEECHHYYWHRSWLDFDYDKKNIISKNPKFYFSSSKKGKTGDEWLKYFGYNVDIFNLLRKSGYLKKVK